MKGTIIFFLLLSFFSQAQNTSENIKETVTGIIPTPQHVELSSGHFLLDDNTYIIENEDVYDSFLIDNFKDEIKEITGIELLSTKKHSRKKKNISFQLVYSLPVKENISQAYTIYIEKDKIVVEACSQQGLFYGSQSLKQLIRYQYLTQNNLNIPAYTIIDYPNVEYRGWMDDISRGPIPTTEFIKEEIRRLSEYKLNYFNLYTEHLFKLDEYPDIAPTDGLTAEEIKEITDFAKDYHIEFIGNQQCFAHAEKTLDNPFYDDIKDTRFNFNPGKEETYVFLEELLSETAQAYESRYFNINCDETESLGNGKAKAYIDSVGGETAYCQHINKVYDILQKYDKDVMMWGDIIAKNPEMIEDLPDDIQFIVWSYGGRDSFDEMIEPFKASGHEFWVAPGASCWASCFPYIENYTKNIANFARDAYKYGAKGVMNTAWDDYGESMFNATWHAMIWCAETSWNTLKSNDEGERLEREEKFNENFNVQYFGDDGLRTTDNRDYLANLYELSGLIDESDMRNVMRFGSLDEPLLDFFESQVDSAASAENHFYKEKSFEIYKNLLKDRSELKVNTEIIDLGILAAYRAFVVTLKNELKISLYNTLQEPTEENVANSKSMSEQFLDSLHCLKKRFVKAWDMESRSYYRDRMTERYDKIARDVMNAGNLVYIETTRQEDNKTAVALRTIFNDRDIYYTIDGSEPDKSSKIYKEPFEIERSCIVKAACFEDNKELIVNEKYILYHKGMGHFKKLNSVAGNYRPEYSGGGDDALLNGLLGSDDYKEGNWQGFYGDDCDIELDFGKKESLNSIKINFITNPYDWILMPEVVTVMTSEDGIQYKEFKSFDIKEDVGKSKTSIISKSLNINGLSSRYIRIIIKNPGLIPMGLPGYNNPSWIFMDEIIIE